MPIANCVVSRAHPQLPKQGSNDLIQSWANEAGIPSAVAEMTINIIVSSTQQGKPCPVMAWLYLPSVWSAEQVNRLQVGLAKALASHLGVGLGDVQVITAIVEPGLVVERAQPVSW